jgi:hypothetical protein
VSTLCGRSAANFSFPGADEQLSDSYRPTAVGWHSEMEYVQMVRDAGDIETTLRPAFASDQTRMLVRVFAGDTHNGVPWTALNPILGLAAGR